MKHQKTYDNFYSNMHKSVKKCYTIVNTKIPAVKSYVINIDQKGFNDEQIKPVLDQIVSDTSLQIGKR